MRNCILNRGGLARLAVFAVFLATFFFAASLARMAGLPGDGGSVIYIRRIAGSLTVLALAAFLSRVAGGCLASRDRDEGGKRLPNLMGNVVSAVLYLLAIVVIAAFLFQKSLAGILATTSVLGIVLGFALQSLIQDFFAGVILNIDRPFSIGDYIQIDDDDPGVVVDVNWRSTRIRTVRDECLAAVPNHRIFSSRIKNFSRPERHYWCGVEVCVDHLENPERVKRVLLAAAATACEGLGVPPPSVRLKEVTDTGAVYLVGYYPPDRGAFAATRDAVLSQIHRHMRQAGVAFAIPKQAHYSADLSRRDDEHGIDLAGLLARTELFASLSPEELRILARGMKRLPLSAGETIIRQGEEGDSMFVLVEGLLGVYVEKDGDEHRVARITPGGFFGEMSLLTGERRAATIRASSDSVLYELPHEVMGDVMARNPELADLLAGAIESRRIEADHQWQKKRADLARQSGREEHRDLLSRIKAFFSVG